jgi:hydrogenase 3 maturation protease
MMEIADRLSERLQGGRKVAFLGVGAPLRADDSIGLYIVSGLEKRLKADPDTEYIFFLGESAPENYSGAIRSQMPSHVVILDAAEMGREPGAFRMIEPDQIGGVSFSTHMLPLKILADYLVKTTACQIVVIGVQPKYLEFGYPISTEVKTAADQFIKEFSELCGKKQVKPKAT